MLGILGSHIWLLQYHMWRDLFVTSFSYATHWSCTSYCYHVLRSVYEGSICILFPFSKPQMKSFSTFCPSLKGNRGVVCTVTLSTDPHTGLGKEYLNVFCILNKRQILQSCGTCWRKMHSHKKTCTNSFSSKTHQWLDRSSTPLHWTHTNTQTHTITHIHICTHYCRPFLSEVIT